MGNNLKHTEEKILKIMTLNYCGIMNSPYEFYCADFKDELEAIGEIFKQLISSYFPSFDEEVKEGKFEWNMGKVDHQFRSRYSPMFCLNFGLHQKENRFLNAKEIRQRWEKVFAEGIGAIKYSKQEKENAFSYDLLMFHSLLRHTYSKQKFQELIKERPDKYKDKFEPFFRLSFLNQKQKCKRLLDGMQSIQSDVFFFQEFTQFFYQEISNRKDKYHIATDKSKDTLIITDRRSFASEEATDLKLFSSKNPQLFSQLQALLNSDGSTSVMLIDDYIFLNFHFSSKKDKNAKQMQSAKEGLLRLKKQFPQYEVIAGGDLNSFMDNFSKEYHLFPSRVEDKTTCKTRTITQGQYKKANKQDEVSKDKIISSLPIIVGKVCLISGTNVRRDKLLIPRDSHPFDHFALMVFVQTPQYVRIGNR